MKNEKYMVHNMSEKNNWLSGTGSTLTNYRYYLNQLFNTKHNLPKKSLWGFLYSN